MCVCVCVCVYMRRKHIHNYSLSYCVRVISAVSRMHDTKYNGSAVHWSELTRTHRMCRSTCDEEQDWCGNVASRYG